MDNTYDQEALPALRLCDTRVSIPRLQSLAPTSCSCPWSVVSRWKPSVQIQRHNQGSQRSDKVWIHTAERYKTSRFYFNDFIWTKWSPKWVFTDILTTLKMWNVYKISPIKGKMWVHRIFSLNHEWKVYFAASSLTFLKLNIQTRVCKSWITSGLSVGYHVILPM